MLVDGAVVVVENIVTRLASGPASLPRLHLVYRAAREVIVPVTSGVLIIIVVFTPLLTLQGLEGKLFTPVALTIVFALAASLLLSLTVVPVLASFFLRSPALNAVSSGSQQSLHETAHEPLLVRRAQALYAPLLAASLAHPRRVVIGATVARLDIERIDSVLKAWPGPALLLSPQRNSIELYADHSVLNEMENEN